ncbi:MAG: GNAT family N-acetyltransferase [Devosiaceae bacterium]|nr:GNAT family N-acetyltransferase [Devosiaceae bacterium]
MNKQKPVIRPVTSSNRDAIWQIMEPIIRAGETYALDRDMRKKDALDYWINSKQQTFIAQISDKILGTYKLGPNQLGGGRHIANYSYMTHHNSRGKGTARAMCVHSIEKAKGSGFNAMQFNFVIANNAPALRLWASLGFKTIGTIPRAFNHPHDGLVDALIMFKSLE